MIVLDINTFSFFIEFTTSDLPCKAKKNAFISVNYRNISMMFVQFLAHPFIQKKLSCLFFDQCQMFEDLRWYLYPFVILALIVSYPAFALAYILFPDSKVSENTLDSSIDLHLKY